MNEHEIIVNVENDVILLEMNFPEEYWYGEEYYLPPKFKTIPETVGLDSYNCFSYDYDPRISFSEITGSGFNFDTRSKSSKYKSFVFDYNCKQRVLKELFAIHKIDSSLHSNIK